MTDIILKDVCKAYQQTIVLENFNHIFKSGERYYLKGSSGAGKTTLLRILMDLETIDSGKILNLSSYKTSAVFQEYRLVEELSSLRNISFVTGKSDDLIISYLNKFGLNGFEFAPVKQLSGGMKQRVSIIRAILIPSDLLLLDEPFKGLDETIKNIIIDEMLVLLKDKTVILTTHLAEEVTKLNIQNVIELDVDKI
ncbi:hypothetical protein AN639_10105 [Candidatus Epulonipiscium fishelsonii]|uniref:Uncharacterized protein n=1 Tax=Candidatus Epulonipiscium fishelsonii TaxID=77094 RepID=A0ACC8X8G3_9FIRM|nr:hypothetical protein AN396_11235 [Epulopiscium sp. SCG-B11WGA-EpuloA1]ONI43674.1 hypothetical protein AN639_10105 [Epulopiscium sp. SCG-B05WGA-EpuloA1]